MQIITIFVYFIMNSKNIYNQIKSNYFAKGGSMKDLYDEIYTDVDIVVRQSDNDHNREINEKVIEKITTLFPDIKIKASKLTTWPQDTVYRIEKDTANRKIKLHFTFADIREAIDGFFNDVFGVDSSRTVISRVEHDKYIFSLMPFPSAPSLDGLTIEQQEEKLLKHKIEVNDIEGGNLLVVPTDHPDKQILFRDNVTITTGPCKYGPITCIKPYSPFNSPTELRHIDEAICLMPYGPDPKDFKIWMYYPIIVNNEAGDTADYSKEIMENFSYNYDALNKAYNGKVVPMPMILRKNGSIKSPPVFNRLFVKHQKKIHPIISIDFPALIALPIHIARGPLSISFMFSDLALFSEGPV